MLERLAAPSQPRTQPGRTGPEEAYLPLTLLRQASRRQTQKSTVSFNTKLQ